MILKHKRPLGFSSEEQEFKASDDFESCERIRPMALQRYSNGALHLFNDSIAVEEDIYVRIQDHSQIVLARTPGNDVHLIVGHLFSRSIIREPEDIVSISRSPLKDALVTVVLKSPSVLRRLFPSPRQVHFNPAQFFEFKKVFEERQSLFKNTGSTHAAGLFSTKGELLAYGEDVGRHNAFDKAVGSALLQGRLEQVATALLSSRLALELAMKAATAGIPILAGFSAATSSSISFAERNNITLVGRIREDSLNIYSNGWRLRQV